MGPSQICGCLFREPRVFTIAHMRKSSEKPWQKNMSKRTWDVQICAKTFTTDRGPPTLAMSIAGSR